MKGINLVFRDLKAMWHHKHGRIALIFLLIVPLIYSSFFIAGYWNPYGRLDQLPVAVVNLDKGGMMDNRTIDAGEEFVNNLKENKDLNFQFVSEKKANQGLKDGDYYMVLTIPKDFSQNVSTLMDEHPKPAKLMYKTNPGNNFVASQISTTATEKMKTKIAASITKSYADGVFAKFQEVAQGLRAAGEGATELYQGTSDAKNGMVTLSDGIERLYDGSEQLKEGSSKLSSGQQKLAQGLERIQDSTQQLSTGLTKLTDGHASLEAGAAHLLDGTNTWADGSKKQAQGLTQAKSTAYSLKTKLEEFMQNHPEAKDDPDFQQIIGTANSLAQESDSLNTGQTQLAAGAEEIALGASKLNAGMKQFGPKMQEAAVGAKQISDGTVQFTSGFAQWEKGFSSLNQGIADLSKGGSRLGDGSNQLLNGLGQLTAGSNELSTKLNDAAQKTSNVHSNDQLTSMFSEPVKLVESKLSNVPNYGIGITPYFLSLAFYVGGIMAANILPLGRRQDLKVNGTVHFINKLALKYSIGLIQAIIVDLVILFGFKVHVASIPMFLLSSIIVSFTFMTFILMLVTLFGVAGKFLAVTFLVLQLATCGGTFPGELGNPVLSKIGSVLPMAHSLRGFQDVITLGDWAQLGHQIMILIFYLVIAGGVTWITSHVQHSKSTVDAAH
ncbi:YhgE/Pip domain-containing protein [Neobacillus drentensis]|uniref:YhgE/Pip domain-containing protein n=1 Tax=Neobacillus drentensis TaxID=220684 RepID=UPI0030028607